jgi:hypothetical protein
MNGDEGRYSHLIIKHGLGRWRLIREHLSAYKVVLLERDLSLLDPAHIAELRLIDYQHVLGSKK